MAASTVRISSVRPMNGHDIRTREPKSANAACSTATFQPPFLTFITCLRSPSVAVSIPPFIARFNTKPGIGTAGSTVISNLTRVLSPSGVSVYFASWVLSWPELINVQLALLSVHLYSHDLFVGDAHGLQLHLDPARPSALDRVEDLGALVLRRPVRCRLDVGDDVEDLLGCCFDDHFAGIADCHGATIVTPTGRRGSIA